MRQGVVGNVVVSLTTILFVLIFGSGIAFSQDIDLDDQTGALNGTVTYTVSINNAPNNVVSLGIEITFDSNVLSFNDTDANNDLVADGATAGPLVTGWSFFGVTEPTAGRIKILGSTIQNAIAAGTSGVLAQLTFTVIGEASTTLNIVNPADDVATWTVGSGTFGPPPVEITPVEAVADSGETFVDMPVTISVLDNDSGGTLTVSNVTDPTNGSATTDGTTVTYTPDAGFAGQDTFDYTASNNTGGSGTATVTVDVKSAVFSAGVETPDPALPVDVAAGTEGSVIQVRVTTVGESVNLTRVMIAFSDLMGDQNLADRVTINVIDDANGNGLADADELPPLASGLLSDRGEDNVLDLPLDRNIPADDFADLLITVQVSQTTTASLVSPRLPVSFMHLGWLGVLSSAFGLVFMGRLRRRFPRFYTALAILLVAGSLMLASCNNNHNGGGDELTFTSSIPANGITGTGDTSGTAFAGPDTAMTGPAVTVMQ